MSAAPGLSVLGIKTVLPSTNHLGICIPSLIDVFIVMANIPSLVNTIDSSDPRGIQLGLEMDLEKG